MSEQIFIVFKPYRVIFDKYFLMWGSWNRRQNASVTKSTFVRFKVSIQILSPALYLSWAFFFLYLSQASLLANLHTTNSCFCAFAWLILLLPRVLSPREPMSIIATATWHCIRLLQGACGQHARVTYTQAVWASGWQRHGLHCSFPFCVHIVLT